MATVLDGSCPASKIRPTADATLSALVVVNPDGSSIGGVGSSPLGTYIWFHVANSGSTTIPTSAKRWSVNFVGTGTANTLGTNTALTGGQFFSDNATPSSAIAIACDGSTVADGFYSTT
jgi:hypothetical protein